MSERPIISREQRLYFRDQLRLARTRALEDAESFGQLLYAFERLGRFLHPGRVRGLGDLKEPLIGLAMASPYAVDIPAEHREWHSPASELFELVRRGRNSALHEGAFARHVTRHSIDLALVLEDALMNGSEHVCDFMVREPVRTYPWHPLSMVRQVMLANSFSFLPVQMNQDGVGSWFLVSDAALASYLRGQQRMERLKRRLEHAVADQSIGLTEAHCVPPNSMVQNIIGDFDGRPILIVDESRGELLGILTSFDLL